MFLTDQFNQGVYPIDHTVKDICSEFMSGRRPRFLFGRNSFSMSIANQIDVDGFIDDFTSDKTFMGRPILALAELPASAIVVSCVVGIHPLTVRRRLTDEGICNLDYFAFQRYSSLSLDEVMFMGEASADYEHNMDAYDSVYASLADEDSRLTLKELMSFRLTRNINYLDRYVDAQDRQYFEPFLQLAEYGETFLDVGCFDGYTTQEFIRRCPNYAGVHVFEPDPNNMRKVRDRLQGYQHIHYHPYGASSTPATLRFHSNGSSSVVSEDGDLEIRVKRIDDVVNSSFSFLKMDIEGGEIPALQGAAEAIRRYHPRLAISVYHKADDLWRVPQTVFDIRDDYDIYIRHYTEGVTETVMFFMPSSK